MIIVVMYAKYGYTIDHPLRADSVQFPLYVDLVYRDRGFMPSLCYYGLLRDTKILTVEIGFNKSLNSMREIY